MIHTLHGIRTLVYLSPIKLVEQLTLYKHSIYMQTHDKDLTNNQLAEVLINKIETTYQILDKKIDMFREEADQNVNRLARIMMEKFDQVDERFNKIETTMATKEDLKATEDKLEQKIDNLENKIDRRMSVVEGRVHIVKNVLEKNLKVKVAW